jgi:hypothetical protein
LSASQASPAKAWEGARMKRIGLIKILALALAVGLCLLIGTAGERERASVNISHPTTIFSLVASRLRAVPPYVRKLIDDATAGFRETIQKHEGPKKSLQR